jgi:hypothetical protein
MHILYSVHLSFHNYELKFIFTLVTVFINTVQRHITNYNKNKSCWFHLTLLVLLTSNQIVCSKIIFSSKESWASCSPMSNHIFDSVNPDCSGWGMLLPYYLTCCSSILIVFCCHCLVHVTKLVGFCVQVRIVMYTFII